MFEVGDWKLELKIGNQLSEVGIDVRSRKSVSKSEIRNQKLIIYLF